MIHRSLALIKRLPLGPIAAPFIGNFLWLRKSFSELESIIPDLHAKYGLIITLWIGSHPTIFISIKSFIHQALVQNSAVFVNRLPLPLTHKVISCNQQNITAKFYGLNWRLFRQQLHLAPWLVPVKASKFYLRNKYESDRKNILSLITQASASLNTRRS